MPDDIRKLLLYRRKFAASIFDGVKKLCYMGLTQIGPKDKEYEQVFVYLNTKAILFDTRLSTPAYHQIGNLLFLYIFLLLKYYKFLNTV